MAGYCQEKNYLKFKKLVRFYMNNLEKFKQEETRINSDLCEEETE